jgi:fibronectin-binding autotransporter adhesin
MPKSTHLADGPSARRRFLALAVVLAAAAPLVGQSTTWTGAAGTSWHVAGNWSTGVPSATVDAVIAATANQPTTAGVAATCRSLTVNAGATLTLSAGGGLTASASAVAINGVVAGPEPLTLTGAGTAALSAGVGGSLAALTLAKTAGTIANVSGTFAIAGNLVVSSGTLNVQSAATLNVGGDASFNGGTLTGGSGTSSVLDVADDVVFAGTTIGAFTTMPNLRVGGDYAGAASWNPTGSGGVVFDAGPSNVSGVCNFADLTVNAGVSVTTSVGAFVGGALTLNGGGAALLCGGAFDVNGSATVVAGGTWNLGAFTHTLAGTGTFNGTVSGAGTVRFDGGGNSTWTGTATLPAVEVAKTASSNQVSTSGAVGVAGDLTVTSGTFFVGSGSTVSVGDDAFFNGGVLQGNSATTAILDVADDVAFAGTTIGAFTTMPNLRVGGDYVGAASWNPTGSGGVTFDAGPSNVSGVCNFADLTVNAGVSVTTSVGAFVGGVLTVNGGGAALLCGGALDVTGAATFSAGGTWNLGPFTHTFGGTGTFNGTVSGSGAVRFDGASSATWSGTATLPAVEVAKTAAANQVATSGAVGVAGDLTVTSGTFFVGAASTVNVGDDAFFNGGVLQGNSATTAIVDVADDVAFAGTTIGAFSTMPNLRVGGDYVGAASWNPTGSGVVVFDAGPSNVSGVCNFADLTVNAGVSVTTTVGAVVNGTLIVNGGGAALVCGGAFDMNGAATFNAGGSWNLGTFTHTVTGSGTFNGTVAGTGVVRFDGATNATWSGTATLPAVEIAKTAAANQVTTTGAVGVAGDLTMTSGTFLVGSSSTVSVGDDAFFNGGILQANSATTAVVDVADDVAFAGTTVGAFQNMPTLRVGGDYVGHPAFVPTGGGTVLFDAGPSVASGTLNFPNLTVNAGVLVTTTAPAAVTGALLVQGGGASLSCGGGLDVDGAATVNVGGTLGLGSFTHAIGAGATFSGALTGTGTVRFDGATFAVVASTPTIPNLEIAKSGAGGQTVQVSGTIAVSGTLTLTSGQLYISGASTTLAVAGTALLAGGELSGTANGALDIEGATTIVAATAASGNMPTVRCAGNWTGAASFDPNAGTVILDGVGARTVSGVANFFNLTVSATTAATTAAAFDVGGTMTVAAGGSFALTAVGQSLSVGDDFLVNGSATMTGLLNVGDDLVVASTGSLVIGAGVHTIGGDLTTSGTFTGPGVLRFVGSTFAQVSASAPITNVEIAKTSPSGLVQFLGVTNVVGNLTVTTGALYVLNATLAVSGSASFAGGELQGAGSGVVDVEGNATFSGTAASTSMPTLRCAGNWTGAASFDPNVGAVFLDGVGPRTVSGVANFFNLTIATGAQVTTATPFDVGGTMTVAAGGSFALTAVGQNLAVGDDLTVDGSATMTGLLAIGDDLAVGAAGSLVIGTGTHTIGGDLTVSGSFTGPGVLRFVGGFYAQITASQPITNVEIAKSGGNPTVQAVGAVNVVGGLTLTTGTLSITSSTFSVSGSAALNGGTLSGTGSGTLDVEGDVVCAGTSAAGGLPHVRCGGHWTGDAAFDPTSGSVTLDGVGARTIAGVGDFFDLRIAVGTQATTTAPLAVDGSLTVDAGGSFALTTPGQNLNVGEDFVANGSASMTGLLAVGDDLVVGAAGSLVIGTGIHTIGGDLTVSGAFTGPGTLRFVGGTYALLTATQPITNVEIAKTGGGSTVQTVGAVTVAGSLTATSGSLYVVNSTVAVTGSASFVGGTLSGGSAGVIDVAGDTLFAGTTASVGGVPTLRCAGGYVADATWAPTSGLIELDGVSPSTVAPLVPGATLTFNDVAIRNGTRTLAADATWAAASTTIHAGAALRAGTGATLSWTANAPTVNGTLGADAGGALALGPAINLTVPVGGTLSLVGTPTNRARLTRAGAAGYGVTVNGTIEAMNFLVEFGGANGLVVPAGATVAPAPRDLRNGFFDNPFSPAAAQLTLTRNAPFDLRYPVFEKSNGVVASNVRTLSGAAIDVVNFAGTQAGEAFDDDPSSLVTWSPAEQSVVSFFAGVPGVSKATLVWTMTSLIDAEAFLIERSDAGGPFAQVFETAAAGLGPYAFVDDPLVALTTYTYKLYQRLTHGVVIELGTATVTPFTTPPPANILDVGPTAGVTTLQQAVNAALAAGGQITILRVQAGTFAPFTLSSTPPGGLRIFADGPGAFVDTTTGPVTIQNLAAGNPVEIRGLAIGSGASTQPALVVQNCDAPVIVDDCVVATGGAVAAARVSDCPAGVALTRLSASGNPGVRVEQASFAAVTGGTIDELSAANGSYVQTCELGGATVLNDGSSTFEPCAGALPRLDVDSFVSIGTPLVFTFQGAPLSYWALVGSFGVDYVAFPASVLQMPVLMNIPSAFIQSEQFADGVGSGTYPGLLPPSPALLGLPFSWQAVQLDLSGSYRFSNLATFVPVL